MVTCREKFATIKRGTVKVEWDSNQHKLLHARNLPHSHVCVLENGEKRITRYPIESAKLIG